ncbi:hypothetical protein U9M48_019269 [Paspalum notatum var. saurae]|uniref:Uncharacterized protein n=1 Tax=Paspalum notatum var. saurae TaxID=547442 RepID=A0AAQ3TCA0_PASNO
MATIQAMYQAQGMTFVMPEVAPAPVPPQWRMFAQMSFSPAPQGSGVQGSNPYQTSPLALGQHGDQQSGQHIDPALGDFVNNLFASEEAATTPTSQVLCEFSEREVKLCVWTLV